MSLHQKTFQAFDIISKREGFKTRKDLNVWCGGQHTRVRLYDEIRRMVPEHCVPGFEEPLRINYRTKLSGYPTYCGI